MTVTHDNFASAVEALKAGGQMLILAYGRPVVISAKAWGAWEVTGKRLVFPSKDGKGFWLRRGKGTEYVLPGLLVVE